MRLTRCLCSRANTHDERSERMICRIQEWNDEATIFSPSKLSIWEAIDRKDCCFFKGTIFDRSFATMIRPGSFAVTKKMKRELLIYNETNHFDHNAGDECRGLRHQFASKETLLIINGKRTAVTNHDRRKYSLEAFGLASLLLENAITTVRTIRKYKDGKDRAWEFLEDFHNFWSLYICLINIKLTKPDWI